MTCVSKEEIANSKTQLNLSGKYLNSFKTLLTLSIGFDTKLGCVAKAKCVSEKEGLQ
jgi:hypothetical protein